MPIARYTQAIIDALERDGEAFLDYWDGRSEYVMRGRLTNAARRAGLKVTTQKMPSAEYPDRGRMAATVIGPAE